MDNYLTTSYDFSLSQNSSTSCVPIISKQTIYDHRQLTNDDSKYQDLTNPNPVELSIFLPNIPRLGKSFIFMNQDASIGNLFINQTIVFPGDLYKVIWNGHTWREL